MIQSSMIDDSVVRFSEMQNAARGLGMKLELNLHFASPFILYHPQWTKQFASIEECDAYLDGYLSCRQFMEWLKEENSSAPESVSETRGTDGQGESDGDGSVNKSVGRGGRRRQS